MKFKNIILSKRINTNKGQVQYDFRIVQYLVQSIETEMVKMVTVIAFGIQVEKAKCRYTLR